MIEAVGEAFWPNYFSQLRDRLLPGGLAGIQAITIQDNLFQTYRREVDFIQRYVEKLTASFRERIRLGCAVTAIERTPHGVVVHDSHDHAATYDHVVIASHSDQALAMLSDADAAERAILGVTGLPRSR